MNDKLLRQQVKDHQTVIDHQQQQISNLNKSIESLLITNANLLITNANLLAMVEELEKRLTSRIVAIEEVL